MDKSNYDTKKVADFYDDFSRYQKKSGINDRHARILQWMKSFGLKNDHHIIEIGCGVGQLTQLLAEYCSKGHVTGVDISTENIQLATQRLSRFSNTSLSVSDMMDASFTSTFDWVVFPDVLEHIPVEYHNPIFKTVVASLKPGGKICIHIPHPSYQDYVRLNDPEKMQIIDQSLSAAELITTAEQYGLQLEHFESYSLFRLPYDYQVIILSQPDPKYIPKVKPYVDRVIQRLRLRGFRK